jgi:hypothetical protein
MLTHFYVNQLRQEWEEKLTHSQEQADAFKKKYMQAREISKGEVYLDQARNLSSKWSSDNHKQNADEAAGVNMNMTFDSYGSNSKGKGPGSVVSISSGLAQSARQIVDSFNCSGMNDRSAPLVDAELSGQDISRSFSSSRGGGGERPPPSSGSKLRRGRSSTKREHSNSQAPQRPQQQYH